MTEEWRVYVGNGQYCNKIGCPIYEAASLDDGYKTRRYLADYTEIPVGTWKRWAFEGFGPVPLTYHSLREFGAYPALYHWPEVEVFFADVESHRRVIGKNREILFDLYRWEKNRRLVNEVADLRGLLKDLERKANDRFNRHGRRSRKNAGALEEARPR